MRRILVVDDSPLIREAARIGLEAVAGHSVETAQSGEESVARAAAQRPDAILLDVVMPGMDGPATLAALRAGEATRDLPVVMVTGLDAATHGPQLEELGAAGMISKPFDPSTLAAQVAQLLRWEP
jgi:CheY-like chemotaxis protein